MDKSATTALISESFVVEGRIINVKSGTITHDSSATHVEPRVLDLLVCLAARRGQVISRIELEKEVWPDIVVGYDALTQSISKLRKALDDDSHPHKIIETVPKRGYRMIPDISPVPKKGVAARLGPANFDRIIPAILSAVLRPGQDSRGRKFHRIAILTLSLLVVGVVVFYLYQQYLTALETTMPSVAVLPFEGSNHGIERSHLSVLVTQELTTVLAGKKGIIIRRQTSPGTANESRATRALAKSIDARFLIEGSVHPRGDNIQLNLRLFDASHNRDVWSHQIESDRENLLAAIDQIGEIVSSHILGEENTVKVIDPLQPETQPDSGLSLESMISSPRRLKCSFGHIAQMNGRHEIAIKIFEDCVTRWNDASSLIALAHIYEAGLIVPRDMARAAMLFKDAAESQQDGVFNSLARYYYGVALIEGRGIAPDASKALYWLKRAADEGVVEAREYINRRFPGE